MIAGSPGGLWLGQQQWEIEELLNTSWQLAAGVNTKLAVSFYVPKAGLLDGFEVRSGAVTTPQDLKCSFQDVTTADNADGGADQFVVVPSASLAANSWIATGPMTSDGTPTGTPRTVMFGQRLAAVIEWNATAGNIRFSYYGQSSQVWHAANVQEYLSSWSRYTAITPVFALRYTDGTYEVPVGCWPLLGPTGAGQSLTSATTPDEIGLKFTVPWDCTLTGITWTGAIANSGADYDVVLYDAADGVLATVSQDANWQYVISGAKQWLPFATPPTLTAGVTYRVTVKPTTTNTLRMVVPLFSSSAIRAAVQSQDTWQWTERTDNGVWTDRPTQRAPFELHIASADAVALGADCLPIPAVVDHGYAVDLPLATGNAGEPGCSASVAAGVGNAGSPGCSATL